MYLRSAQACKLPEILLYNCNLSVPELCMAFFFKFGLAWFSPDSQFPKLASSAKHPQTVVTGVFLLF